MKGKRGKDNLGFLKSHHAQVTIFVILAVIIVAIATLIYFLYPSIKSIINPTNDPNSFIQTCMKDKIKNVINNVSLQGGSVNPDFYYDYQGTKVEYLCYTNQYYHPCIIQQPRLVYHIENEIKNNIQSTADSCFNDLEKSYKRKGYSVNLVKGNTTVDLLPQRILITFNNDLTLTKGESQNYKKFSIALNNNLYELASISNSILNWESTYGDAETTVYMNYYHNLEVEKKKQDDGTTIYILTDLNNGNKFQFASRSLAWPPGYGINQTTP